MKAEIFLKSLEDVWINSNSHYSQIAEIVNVATAIRTNELINAMQKVLDIIDEQDKEHIKNAKGLL
jgi:hypothetical protein